MKSNSRIKFGSEINGRLESSENPVICFKAAYSAQSFLSFSLF